MGEIKSGEPQITSSDRRRLVSVLHTERSMRVYGITESELRTITVINVAVTALFSLATGLLASGVDLHKDILLTAELPENAAVLRDVVRPGAFGGAAILYFLGGLAWFHRGGFIRTIKKESGASRP